ncbi:MAG TPA: preprotein translocase subunit SecE [Candidatus Merdiplasma excrementigallinarum]|uniref:Protein translocase subunit SecE n=1 Tax=Candidatus Merdiplasma excrementigallinarum TaxID=2840864 RepID=A0A9D1P012_9FIRM|nr:preprotein translocase subunit SecE [Candidatus Merdiplasma excrementigallinarum]
MGKAESTPKKSWLDGLKAEFRKIIWPSRHDIQKQTIAVVVVSVVLGVIIALLDFIVQHGVDFLVNIHF